VRNLPVAPLGALVGSLMLLSASVSAGASEPTELDLALIQAAWENDVETAAGLIARGADVNQQDGTQQSAYLISTSEGYADLLELTLANGADVHARDGYNGTGLIRAAERGHADIVGRLLQTDIDVDHVNRLGWTALHEAIILGDGSDPYVDTVRSLVAGGVDVRLPPVGDTVAPLDHAQSRGQERVARTLRDVTDTPAIEEPDATLLTAAGVGDADAVVYALRAGANIQATDALERTPLLLAVAADHLPVARLLVTMGADVDALDSQHDTPWLVTGVTGNVEIAKALLAADPDLSLLNRYGGTSLIPAADRGHVEYVRWVIGTGVDLDHVNDLGWTALLEAVILGDGSSPYQEIVGILVESGADPTITDDNGVTSMEHALASGYAEIASLLAQDS
jgi:ankyrin repeat protein